MLNKYLGAIVAQGRTADIHAWKDDQTVLKLYHNWFQLEWIREEAARSSAVHALGLPIPKVGELVQINGRNGLIFERVYGENMLAMLQQKPELASTFAPRLAELHIELHTLDARPDIPQLHQKLEEKINRAEPLSDALKTALINRLHTLPVGQSLCHGDFHPGNVMVSTNGELGETVVDWNDCALGNPLADVARSTVLLLGGITGGETPNPALETLIRTFHQQYLARYFAVSQRARAEYEQWLPVVAGARLSENITALEPWLLSEAKKIND